MGFCNESIVKTKFLLLRLVGHFEEDCLNVYGFRHIPALRKLCLVSYLTCAFLFC